MSATKFQSQWDILQAVELKHISIWAEAVVAAATFLHMQIDIVFPPTVVEPWTSVPLFQIAWHICAKVNICTNYAQYMHARCEFISRLPEVPGAPSIPLHSDKTRRNDWGLRQKKTQMYQKFLWRKSSRAFICSPRRDFCQHNHLFFLHETIKMLRPQEAIYKEKVSKKQEEENNMHSFFYYTAAFLCSVWNPPHPPRAPATISFLIRCDLMFYLALHFLSLRCRSPYLPGKVSPDCWGNPAPPAGNESGQGVRTAQ